MRWVTRRLAQMVITLVSVITLSFFIIRFMPGGPMTHLRARLLEQGAEVQRVDQLVQSYTNVNPSESLIEQYFSFIGALLQGDLGQSFTYDQSVIDLIISGLPWTMLIVGLSLFLIYGIGILLGAVMAYFEGTRFDSAVSGASILLASIPFYILGIFLILLFAYQFNFFPAGGRYNESLTVGFNLKFIASVLHHAALPTIALVMTQFGTRALSMRGNSIRILGSDYLRVADLRGLKKRRIITRYLGYNAVLPMYTQFMVSIGFTIGSAIVLEKLFSYTGLGFYMYRAVKVRDDPLMMGAFLVITVIVVFAVFFADLTYGYIDPRASIGGSDNESY